MSEWTAKRDARIMAAARQLKEALSASPQAEVFIEDMLPDWDFKAAVTREDIDEVCKEIYEAFAQYNPVRQLRDSDAFKDVTVQNLEYVAELVY